MVLELSGDSAGTAHWSHFPSRPPPTHNTHIHTRSFCHSQLYCLWPRTSTLYSRCVPDCWQALWPLDHSLGTEKLDFSHHFVSFKTVRRPVATTPGRNLKSPAQLSPATAPPPDATSKRPSHHSAPHTRGHPTWAHGSQPHRCPHFWPIEGSLQHQPEGEMGVETLPHLPDPQKGGLHPQLVLQPGSRAASAPQGTRRAAIMEVPSWACPKTLLCSQESQASCLVPRVSLSTVEPQALRS